jgi:hypothetical protein
VWSVNAPDTLNPPSGKGCNVSATFNIPGPRTLTLSAVDNIVDEFGRTISETGSQSESITVKALPPGPHISATNPVSLGILQPPFEGQTLSFELNSKFPPVIQITGVVSGFSGTTSAWTMTDSSGTTTPIGTGLTVNWPVPPLGTYTITMNTTDSSGHLVGTAAMGVNLSLTIR